MMVPFFSQPLQHLVLLVLLIRKFRSFPLGPILLCPTIISHHCVPLNKDKLTTLLWKCYLMFTFVFLQFYLFSVALTSWDVEIIWGISSNISNPSRYYFLSIYYVPGSVVNVFPTGAYLLLTLALCSSS